MAESKEVVESILDEVLAKVVNQEPVITEDLLCGICLDLVHNPHLLDPCHHYFCGPCLRRMGRQRHSKCPVCRQPISKCYLHVELVQKVQKSHPKLYLARQTLERESNVHLLPLPPVRRPLLDSIIEWVVCQLGNPTVMIMMALALILVQIGLLLALDMMQQSRNGGRGLLKYIPALTRLRGMGQPLKVVVVYLPHSTHPLQRAMMNNEPFGN